jgi:anthranilate phosphoribosyltransferase
MELGASIAKIASGEDLTLEEAEAAFRRVMSGEATPVQIAALLMGLRTKGHAPSEIAGGVRALQEAMIPVRTPAGSPVVDTCGTGGGVVTTFNISTAAALVAAGAGVPVAKHGNRSFTSRSGSADVLEALGVEIQLAPEGMGRVLEEAGIVFMFAPLLHPAIRHAAPVRRELGITTILNLLGPLANPAGARRQVVGVAEPGLRPLLAEALRTLGHEHALVLHGAPGMDEVSPVGPTEVSEVAGGELRSYRTDPEALGVPLARPEEIGGGTPAENAARILAVLEGRERGGARSVVLLNAAAALRVAGVVEDLREGVVRAAEAVDAGAAREALERLRRASRRYAPTGGPSESGDAGVSPPASG